MRCNLTREIIDTFKPPARGECWIADTQIKGFGLRVWRTKNGTGAQYGIRWKGHRRSYPSDPNEFYRSNGKRPEFIGDYLEDARKWAKDELASLSIGFVRETENNGIFRPELMQTLDKAADTLRQTLLNEGRSQKYVDQLVKCYSKNTPDNIKHSQVNAACVVSFTYQNDASKKNRDAQTARRFIIRVLKLINADDYFV